MKVLIIGSGAREHAIAFEILKNKKVESIYVSPGNAGTSMLEKTENVILNEIDDILNFAKNKNIDMTIVGNEALLVDGIVDLFKKHNLNIFGPDKASSMLEGSKAYSKLFMKKYGIKTAAYESFDNIDKAKEYIASQSYPLVVKASGLALGKGVIICQNEREATTAIDEIMGQKVFGDAGNEIVIEEFLEGFEASILSITDSNIIVPFISAKDHKKIGDNDTGPNTGGMGSIAPNPHMTDDINHSFIHDILEPSLTGIKKEGLNFCGFIFFGIMITKKGVYLLEYNMRLGDPETQVVLPMMETDFLSLIIDTINGNLSKIEITWKKGYALCVVASSIGYPDKYEKGLIINNLDKIESRVYMAGVDQKNDDLVTSGGRVLSVVNFGYTLADARKKVYDSIGHLDKNILYYRKDIGDI